MQVLKFDKAEMSRYLKKLSLLILFCSQVSCQDGSGGTSFNIVATGTPANVSISLCSDGNTPSSCQSYNVSALNLSILTTAFDQSFPNAGIKVNTPNYALTGCTATSNGYCLFAVSDSSPANIVMSSTQYSLAFVGNAGNDADTTGFGSVNYEYQIGKYDVTIWEYVRFLNAVAKTDPYELYDLNMGTDLNSAGISRSGSSGNYTYSVMNNDGVSANRPITYVDWFNAARFANWMANGQPSGAENSTTTENGAYALNGAVSGDAVPVNGINPNTGAVPIYRIPTENEWYKAAYYDPTLDHGLGGYYAYATKSDTTPGNKVGSSPNQANFFTTVFSVTQSSDYLAMAQNYLTDVGAFSGSPSYYGTYDQSGNVWQWNDLDGTALPYRGMRGGYWWSGSVPLQSILYSTDATTRADNGLGFRLASPVN